MLYDWKFTVSDDEIVERREEGKKSFEKDWHEGIKHFHLLWTHLERSFKENQWVMSLRVRKRSKQRAIIFLMYNVYHTTENYLFPGQFRVSFNRLKDTDTGLLIHLHPFIIPLKTFVSRQMKISIQSYQNNLNAKIIIERKWCKEKYTSIYHKTNEIFNFYLPKYLSKYRIPLVLEILENFHLKENNKKERNIIDYIHDKLDTIEIYLLVVQRKKERKKK